MKIAVTGNIGSGKTEFLKFLLSLNYKCISSDKIIAQLYKNNSIRDVILGKLGISEKDYKKKIIDNLSDEKFNRKLKKIIYKTLIASYKS